MGLLHASKSGFFPWCLNLNESPDTSGSNLGFFIALEKAMELYWKSKSIIIAASGTITTVEPFDAIPPMLPTVYTTTQTWSGSAESVSGQSYLDRVCGTAIFPSVTSYVRTLSFQIDDETPTPPAPEDVPPFEGISFGNASSVVTNIRNSSNNIFAWPFGEIPYRPGDGFDLLGATNIASLPFILSSSAQTNFQYCGIFNFFGIEIPLYVNATGFSTGYVVPGRTVTGSLNVSISVGQTYDFS